MPISNLLRLPVLGREEDTADQIAAFVMLQFGRDIARTLIKGETFGWNQRQRTASRFWGPHSTALQRQHTFLCLAYGSDPQGFEDFVTKFRWLPKARADNCANEYQQVLHAFRETIVPHLDMALVKQMREKPLMFPMPGRGEVIFGKTWSSARPRESGDPGATHELLCVSPGQPSKWHALHRHD